jgi:hypothetical protein
MPLDVVNLIVDHVETDLSLLQARNEGKRLSLVAQDWRDAGQRLVFRSIQLDSLDVYSPLIRLLAKRDFRLAGFVRILKVKHLVQQDPSSSAAVRDFLDALSQLQKLRLEALTKQMSGLLSLFSANRAGRHLNELTLSYVPSAELFDCDHRDLTRLARFQVLDSLCLTLPEPLAPLLPSTFPSFARISLRTFRLHLPGTATECLAQTLISLTSLLTVETLEVFVLFAPSSTLHLQRWLSNATELRTLQLVLSASDIEINYLLSLVAPSLSRLSSLQFFHLKRQPPAASSFSAWTAVGAGSTSWGRPDSLVLHNSLSSLPSSLELLALDVDAASRNGFLQRHPQPSETWCQFMEARLQEPLREIRVLRRSQDGALEERWRWRKEWGKKIRGPCWVRPFSAYR